MRPENKKFLDWYNSLERYEKTFLNNLIMRYCNVSRVTVYTWLKGDRKIIAPYQRIINQITGMQLFDVIPINKSQISI